MLLERGDDSFRVWVTKPKTPGEKVATPLGDRIPVDENIELPLAAGRTDGFDSETTLDEGRETRDLALIVASGRTVDDLDFHGRLLLS